MRSDFPVIEAADSAAGLGLCHAAALVAQFLQGLQPRKIPRSHNHTPAFHHRPFHWGQDDLKTALSEPGTTIRFAKGNR
jgi:hypothetical protein